MNVEKGDTPVSRFYLSKDGGRHEQSSMTGPGAAKAMMLKAAVARTIQKMDSSPDTTHKPVMVAVAYS